MAFDVFISFKNTDQTGARTPDSQMAEDLYYALKDKGINAFYSNISISERGEHRFGKMIKEALEQSSIFVAVSTSIENLESEWVEYEIESFHGEMLNRNKDQSKTAMYSYITKGVSVNHLPMELRRCQTYYELKDLVAAICTRLQKTDEVMRNFMHRDTVDQTLSVGTLVDGRYKILNEIGRGGMSVVYLALDIRVNRLWAIKVVRKDSEKDFEIVKQGLIVEADLLKSFDHPNLPRIVDVIETRESFALIMDYVEGESLDRMIRNKGPQSEEKTIEWAKQLCDVLHYLHTRKTPIIYRDLKPANILLRNNGNLTLIDFGTAREYKETSVADTVCLGTRGYAAPEQYGGMGQTDQRTDIYTLGVTLYNICTGQNPAEPPYEIEPIRRIRPELSHGLEYIIEKCVRKNPDHRYASAQELRADLDNIHSLTKKLRRKGLFRETVGGLLGKKPDKKTPLPRKTPVPMYVPQPPKPPIPVAKPQIPMPTVPQPSPIPNYEGPTSNLEPPVIPRFETHILGGDTDLISDTVLLCDKVAVCVTVMRSDKWDTTINVYFATQENRGRISKSIVSRGGDIRFIPGEKSITIARRDMVKLRAKLDQPEYADDVLEFKWADYVAQKLDDSFYFRYPGAMTSQASTVTLEILLDDVKVLEMEILL